MSNYYDRSLSGPELKPPIGLYKDSSGDTGCESSIGNGGRCPQSGSVAKVAGGGAAYLCFAHAKNTKFNILPSPTRHYETGEEIKLPKGSDY